MTHATMASSLGRENFFWHKLHSLTGIVPMGVYMVQHLTLNSFSWAGPDAFNGIIGFFEGMPRHLSYGLKYGLIWLPLLFHMIYGLFIAARGQQNYTQKAYKYRENMYYTMQRLTGVIAMFFLLIHMGTTSVAAQFLGVEQTITYENWDRILTAPIVGVPYLGLVFYCLGIMACTWHLAYGIWNFCIRWGITISEKSQMGMAKFSLGAFVALTLLGWFALVGFLVPSHPLKGHKLEEHKASVSAPMPTEIAAL
jgi:succinate dehydrogenase / fumarate reductase cytochrome b subunit